MSLSLRRIIKISRPRFWLYTFGPYLLGCTAAIGSQVTRLDWVVIAFAIFFTLPANLLIYGVNDMFDYETDKDNPKKQGYEALVIPKEYAPLRHAILFVAIPFIFLLPIIPPWAVMAMIGFLFFSIFYSAKPIRAKAKPFLDSLFNVLYVFPGIFGFLLAGGHQLSWMYIAAGCLWCMAMHAYSAVPDIEADRTSGVETIATKLGATRTLALCGALYAFAGILASIAGLGLIASILALVYVALIGISLWIPKGKLQAVYRYFPFVNALAGFTIFVVTL